MSFLTDLAWIFGFDGFATRNGDAKQVPVDSSANSHPGGQITPEMIEVDPLVHWIVTGEDP